MTNRCNRSRFDLEFQGLYVYYRAEISLKSLKGFTFEINKDTIRGKWKRRWSKEITFIGKSRNVFLLILILRVVIHDLYSQQALGIR